MAKEKSSLSKDERKALKAAKKEAKSLKPESLAKPEKKDKDKDKSSTQKEGLKILQAVQVNKFW